MIVLTIVSSAVPSICGWLANICSIRVDPARCSPKTKIGPLVRQVCALAYTNRVTLLAKVLGQSETRINRQLKRKPR